MSSSHDTDIAAKIADFKSVIDEQIKNVVKDLSTQEREKVDKDTLDKYNKILRIKIKDDFGPYARIMKRRYIVARKKKINAVKKAFTKKQTQLSNYYKQLDNDDNDYIAELQDIYGVSLEEHKRYVYEAYIKKSSNRTYSKFLRNIVYKTFYTTLSPPTTSYWRKELLSKGKKNELFSSSDTAASFSNSAETLYFQIGKKQIPMDFMQYYSKFVPHSKTNEKYLQEVVYKVNEQVEVINYVSPLNKSCFWILRDVLLSYHNNDVSKTVNWVLYWDEIKLKKIENFLAGSFQYDDLGAAEKDVNVSDKKYRRRTRQKIEEFYKKNEQQQEEEDDDEQQDDEADIHDEKKTFRRTLRIVDMLIHKAFDPMNDHPFLARTYFSVRDVDNPMMYLALEESSYDLVYNLFLEFLLLVLVYRIKHDLGLKDTASPFNEITVAFENPENHKHPLNIAQTIPGLLIAIQMHILTSKRCPEVMLLFRYDVRKIKGRIAIRRHLVDVALLMIRSVVEIIYDPEPFIKKFINQLMNKIFLKLGIPM